VDCSLNENEQYSYEDVQVATSDVASLYPNLIINEECIRYPVHTKGDLKWKMKECLLKNSRNSA
jgi:hypothetical protein